MTIDPSALTETDVMQMHAPQMLDLLRWVEKWIVRHGLDTADLINGQKGALPLLDLIRTTLTKVKEEISHVA